MNCGLTLRWFLFFLFFSTCFSMVYGKIYNGSDIAMFGVSKELQYQKFSVEVYTPYNNSLLKSGKIQKAFLVPVYNVKALDVLEKQWRERCIACKTEEPDCQARFSKRLEALQQSRSSPKSWALENCLIREFDESYNMAVELANHHAMNLDLKNGLEVIDLCVASVNLAELERGFAISDLVYDVVKILKVGCAYVKKAGTAIIKGATVGVTTSIHGLYKFISPIHYCELAQTARTTLKAIFVASVDHQLMVDVFDQKYATQCEEILDEFSKKYRLCDVVFAQSFVTTLTKLKAYSWDDLLENGVAFGAELVTDLVCLHIAMNGAYKAARLVHEVATVIKEGKLAEGYYQQIAGMGKALVEEGTADEWLKKSAMILDQEILVQNKKLDVILQGAGSKDIKRSIQFWKPGNYQIALEDFNSLNLSDVKILEKSKYEGFRGTLADGRTINVRTGSSEGCPTLEISNPGKKTIKIRYGNKDAE